jgi:hypothetical protein
MARIVWCSVEIYLPCLHSVVTVGMESVLGIVDIVKIGLFGLNNSLERPLILSKLKMVLQLSDI